MQKSQQPPPVAQVPAGSAAARPQQTIVATIDLTDDCDYEPPAKVVVSNSRDALPKPQIDLTQPGTSTQQPSTSNHLPEPKKQGPCMICGISPCHWALKTDCRHHLCKYCFARAIKPQKDPLTMSVCPVPYCKTVIGDEVIKKSLPTVDYIFYLETLRDTLRGALKAGTEFSLETDIEMTPLTLAEKAARRANVNVNKGAAPKRRLSWLVQSTALENQPFFSNPETVKRTRNILKRSLAFI